MNPDKEIITSNKANDIETFYEIRVLPHFHLGKDTIRWQGHSELDIDSSVHYFAQSSYEYILAFQDHGEIRHSQIEGNAIAPYQTAVLQRPKNGDLPYVEIRRHDNKYIPDITGYFMLFRVET